MTMPVTAAEVKKLIQESEAAGIPPVDLAKLREHLLELQEGILFSNADSGFVVEEVESVKRVNQQGCREVIVSSVPSSPDDDDFEGLTFKPVKPRLVPKP